MSLRLEQPTKKIKVPSLAAIDEFWACEKKDRLWEVRGLTTVEVFKATETSLQRGNFNAIIETLASQFASADEKADSLKNLLGLGDDVPPSVARAIEYVVFGSINPKITTDVAVKLATYFPSEFISIRNAVEELTTDGGLLKKSRPSTATKK